MQRKEKQMKIKRIAAAAAVCAMVGMAGCMTVPSSFVDKSKPMDKYEVVGKEVAGSFTQVSVFGFGSSLGESGQREAYKAALKKAPGADALIEMAVDVSDVNAIWVHILTTKVTGTPVKAK